jgi:hypothetical protein
MIDSILDAADAAVKPEPVTEEMQSRVERELLAFDEWFAAPVTKGGCGNTPMARPEIALLRTYLYARLTKRFPSVLEPTHTSSAEEPA